MRKKRFGLVVALGLALGCLGGCKEKEKAETTENVETTAKVEETEKIEIVDGHETINGEILINEKNFPDEVFRKYVGDTYDKDANGRLAPEEYGRAMELFISDMGITDLKGIECFYNLIRLSCRGNQLTELDVSKNQDLTALICDDNRLEKLSIYAYRMNVLTCSNNQLTELDLSNCPSIEQLDCSNNPLMKLDLSNCFDNEPKLTVDPGVEVILPKEKRENPFWN